MDLTPYVGTLRRELAVPVVPAAPPTEGEEGGTARTVGQDITGRVR
ncbi:hypothetical protein LKL35_14395 [Streptomyces sp. ET3-23]|nr:hypothetical protein [Streptomyces sp. ET3-23]MCC2276590.1 hypothetical protein [Streptomyces sp. ET3-23]